MHPNKTPPIFSARPARSVEIGTILPGRVPFFAPLNLAGNIISHTNAKPSFFALSFPLLRREVWPEDDCFGSLTSAPEDELMLLKEIFLANLPRVAGKWSLLPLSFYRKTTVRLRGHTADPDK